jgi:uncharacterized protein (DUF4415 family)
MSKNSTIEVTLDPLNPPPLTQEQKEMLAELKKMPDSEIDYSDIPHQDFIYRPVKKVTTMRLDADVLSWLRSFGKGYQSRANAILRHEMMNYRAKA